jgi:hypothetical protein
LGLSILGCLASMWAQSDRGSITGTVSDPSGAAIAGASVTAANAATGVSTRTSTDSTGTYTIPLLPPGTYQVTAERAGFKTYVHSGVVIEVGQTARLDVPMQLGDARQTIEVKAALPQLRPDSSDLGTVITGQQVIDLPLAGQGEQRNPAFFTILAPGVTGRGTAYQPPDSPNMGTRTLSTTVSGSQSGSTEFHLDGSIIANAAEFSGDFRNLGFPQDAVGEFKITTIGAPAEYSRSGGGITSFTLKSGGNQLHGSAYEYFRNEKLDAVPFFVNSAPPGCNQSGRPIACRPVNRQNEFGVNAGGPIRKDKTFFFGWYNGFYFRKPLMDPFATVPTDAFKNGDLSAYLGPQLQNCGPTGDQPCMDAVGRPILQGAVYDPRTTRTFNGQTLRDPFSGNIIPPDRFDSVAKNIIPLISRAEPPRHLAELSDFSRSGQPNQPMGNKNRSLDLGHGQAEWLVCLVEEVGQWTRSLSWSARHPCSSLRR